MQRIQPSSWAFIEEHLAEVDHRERSRIDHALSHYLTTLAFWHEMKSSIERERPQPRCSPGYVKGANGNQTLSARYFDISPSNEIREQGQKALVPLVQMCCALLWLQGKHDQKWLETATTVRKNQADFWSALRIIYRKQCKMGGLYDADIEDEIAEPSTDLSAEHLAEVVAERDSVLEGIAQKLTKATPAQKSVAKPHTQWGTSHDDQASPRDRRGKTAPWISVKAESKRIFTIMLAPGHKDACKGKVTWDQVVSAMTNAGFAAIMNGGSAVRFDPVDHSGLQGSIVFHKPHPKTIVEAVTLRVVGKRLKKWFGFEVDTFVDRKKEMV